MPGRCFRREGEWSFSTTYKIVAASMYFSHIPEINDYDGPFHLKFNGKVNGFGILNFVDSWAERAYFGWSYGDDESSLPY